MTFKLPEGRTSRVLFHACGVQKPILYLGCLAQQGTGVIFAQTLVHSSFQTGRGQTQVHKEDNLFFVKGMVVALLSTAGVSDEVAQELQMPSGPQLLDVEEPVPIKS